MSKPKTIAAVGVAIVALTVLTQWRVSSRRAEPTVAATVPSVEISEKPAGLTRETDQSGKIARLSKELSEERQARMRAETEVAALGEKVAPLASNVVVSLGKVEDIGRRAGGFLPVMAELQGLMGRDRASLTPEEKRRLLELQREHASLLGALPQIMAFQDNPNEYGRFFSSMLQEASGLTDQQAAQVETFMQRRATLMNQLELNAAKQPADAQLEEAWEERRDKFNEETANLLKATLPPGAAEQAGLGPELMEFLEMDFDKLTSQVPEARAQRTK